MAVAGFNHGGSSVDCLFGHLSPHPFPITLPSEQKGGCCRLCMAGPARVLPRDRCNRIQKGPIITRATRTWVLSVVGPDRLGAKSVDLAGDPLDDHKMCFIDPGNNDNRRAVRSLLHMNS